jgi:hypothetical protein
MEVTPAVSVTPAWVPVNQTGADLPACSARAARDVTKPLVERIPSPDSLLYESARCRPPKMRRTPFNDVGHAKGRPTPALRRRERSSGFERSSPKIGHCRADRSNIPAPYWQGTKRVIS